MFYKLLGMVVWKGGKWAVRRRYGHVVRPVAVGGLLALLLVIALAVVAKRGGGESGD